MQSTKFSDISKKIKVIDYTLSSDGLWIAYELDGKEIDLISDPEQTASILKTHGLIEDFSGAGREVIIESSWIEHHTDAFGEPYELNGTSINHWLEFRIELSQREVLNIVTKVEQDKLFNKSVDKFGNIPDILKQALKPFVA